MALADTVFDSHQVKARARLMRLEIIKMLTLAGSGHPGGSLSAADIVATLYFGGVMRHDPENPDLPDRDRFILSKGHAAPVQYAALALAGYFDRGKLATLRKLGSCLQGHPDAAKCPGVEVSTGSLGQGLSIAAGLAQGLQLAGTTTPAADPGQTAGRTPPRVYVLLGDGELQEGQVWEAALYAAHYGLDNLVAIVDRNGLQIDGQTESVMALGDVAAKFADFGWDVDSVDGHDVNALYAALTTPNAAKRPRVIVARTVKGKGVSFMENQAGWHGNAPSAEQCEQAVSELQAGEDGAAATPATTSMGGDGA
ncbi:MAG: transketolase [Actinomycetes bacterium]|jgi:transketolase|nr:transketolase [Actinomycetes bacterium]